MRLPRRLLERLTMGDYTPYFSLGDVRSKAYHEAGYGEVELEWASTSGCLRMF